MQHITRDGMSITVGRVDRRSLDAINIPKPVPPSREVETWGGEVESVPVYDDVTYQRNVIAWMDKQRLAVMRACLPALDFEITDRLLVSELRAAGIDADPDDRWLFFRYGIAPSDKRAVVALVYYQSTVTERGLSEAEERLGYTWRNKAVGQWKVPVTHGARGDIGAAMQAAYRSNMTWEQFCDLPGPEQSLIVKFWSLEDKLSWLCLNAQSN